MSHQVPIRDLAEQTWVHVAMARDSGRLLNQRFPEVPKEAAFWVGGVVAGKANGKLMVELKPFRDLATPDLEYSMFGNVLHIPIENIDRLLSYSGTIWVLLKG
jgi:hypothetical protein